MATVTLAQLQSRGFSLVSSANDRLQRWTGSVEGQSVEIVWDSQANKAFRIKESDDAFAILRTAVALALSVSALVNASTLHAQAKSEIQAALAAAISDVSL